MIGRYSLERRVKRRNNPKNQETIKKIVDYIRQNPLISSDKIDKHCHTKINIFFNMKELCEFAGVKYYNGHERRIENIKIKIINYIKENPNTNQWDINKNCKTHVQETFKDGIREAFFLAGVEYPDRRVYGIADPKIKQKALDFEDYVIKILSVYGDVIKHPKNKNGIPDAIFKTSTETYLVEIKHYLTKPISKSQILQLNKYLEGSKYNQGLLVTFGQNKKDKVYIGNNRISIITADQLLLGAVA